LHIRPFIKWNYESLPFRVKVIAEGNFLVMKYTSRDNLKSGMHLGGLGIGTLQIFPDGTRGVFTGQNNWERP
jgi:hypothetical protein